MIIKKQNFQGQLQAVNDYHCEKMVSSLVHEIWLPIEKKNDYSIFEKFE